MNFCLPARCCLCRFSLFVNDEIVIGTSNWVHHLCELLTGVVRENGTISDTLRFQSLMFEGENTYVLCSGFCSQDGQATGCHVECNRIVPDINRMPLIKALTYQYEPLSVQDLRRIRWLHLRWTGFVLRKYRLPAEICRQIAQDCLQQFAITNAILSLDRSPRTRPIQISKSICARFTLFEGLSYMVSFSSNRIDCSGPFESCPAIFVAEDHLGIRRLQEGISPLIQKGRIGIWWRKARPSVPQADVWTKNDVSRSDPHRITIAQCFRASNCVIVVQATRSQRHFGRCLAVHKPFDGIVCKNRIITCIHCKCHC